MPWSPEILSFAISLLALIAGTVILSVSLANRIAGGVAFAFLALASGCYSFAAVVLPLIAR